MDNIGMKIHLSLGFEAAREKVIELLKVEGFGVLTDINVKETLKQKLDIDFIKYEIIGACNPPLAYRAISANYDVGLFLPCNVILYEEGSGTTVNIIDPMSMVEYSPQEDLRTVATEAKTRLERVRLSLANP
jgi:uncharacterized protein (DUF302 family)